MDSNNLQINKIQFIISFGLSIKKLPWARIIAQLSVGSPVFNPSHTRRKERNVYVKDGKSENAQQSRDSSLAAESVHIKHHN